MDSSIFRRSLDIHQQTTQAHLAVRKGDTARKIVASLSDGGRPYTIDEGCYAVFKAKKPDGNVLYNDCAIANNCITYEFTEQTAASAGHMACEFQLYGADGQLITSPRLAIIVNGLVYDDSEVESSGEFTALEKAMADVAELKANGLRGDPGPVGPEGPQGPRGETPFYVDLAVHGDGSWYADEGFDTIRQEYNSGRQVVCRLELDQQFLELPMVKEAAGVFTFGAIIGGQEWQAIISPGEDGAAAVAVTVAPLAMQTDLRPAATDEIYFDITDDGIISLKPEYRGACSSNSYPYGLSDNGKGRNGTRNKELPQEIVIPAEVGGVAVSALAVAMFMHNRRVKKLWLPAGVAEIPQNFCAEANALEEISGTENVHTLGKNAFYRTGIRKAYFPSLATIVEGSNFMGCANLVIADLGHVLMQDNATIPKRCFSGCGKLEYMRHADGVTCIREEGLYATSRLRELAFLPNLTAVEKYGLLLSRADYAWEELADCTFGELSTSNDINTTDYSGCNFTPCNTPMRSTFEQHNPLWADKQIGNCQRTYADGCAVVSAAMIYSALMDVDMDSPEVFVAAVGAVDESLLDLDIANGELDNSGGADHSWMELARWFDAVGCATEYVPSVSAENVQAVYDALAGGALVFARVCAGMDDGNHVAVIHGVNGYGEFLVTDPSSAGRQIGVYEAANYPMSVQNLMRDNGDHFMIVRKK